MWDEAAARAAVDARSIVIEGGRFNRCEVIRTVVEAR